MSDVEQSDFDYLCEQLGIEFHPHDGRATYGNRLRKKKVPLETIAKLMRHESPDETFRSYIGYDDEELRQVQDLLVPEAYSQRKEERLKDSLWRGTIHHVL